MEVRRRLENEIGIDIYDASQSYLTLEPKMTADHKASVRELLNYLEEMSIAIKHAIIDDDIAYDNASYLLIAYDRWAKHFIEEKRRISGSQAFVELQLTVERWVKRQDEERKKILIPGKSALGK